MSDEEALKASGPAMAPSDSDQLAALKIKRRELEAAREARESALSPADAIAQEQQAIADEEAIAEAEAKYGPVKKKIYVVSTPGGTVIVKQCHHVLFKKFQDTEEKDVQALERLVRPCLVYPSADRFDRMLEEQPAILIKVADAVTWLAGWRAKENQKK